MDHQTMTDAAKGAPPTAVAALNFFGVTVPDLINDLTLLYVFGLVIQQAWRAYKFFRDRAA